MNAKISSAAHDRSGFAHRLHQLCDEMKLPRHGRQTQLAHVLGVTQGATKKWLNSEGFPTYERRLAICSWAGVSLTWLDQGLGPKRAERQSTSLFVLDEALRQLSADDRRQVMDFLAFKIEKSQAFNDEQIARYKTMIEAYKSARILRR